MYNVWNIERCECLRDDLNVTLGEAHEQEETFAFLKDPPWGGAEYKLHTFTWGKFSL